MHARDTATRRLAWGFVSSTAVLGRATAVAEDRLAIEHDAFQIEPADAPCVAAPSCGSTFSFPSTT
jgi:hypothetical protein